MLLNCQVEGFCTVFYIFIFEEYIISMGIVLVLRIKQKWRRSLGGFPTKNGKKSTSNPYPINQSIIEKHECADFETYPRTFWHFIKDLTVIMSTYYTVRKFEYFECFFITFFNMSELVLYALRVKEIMFSVKTAMKRLYSVPEVHHFGKEGWPLHPSPPRGMTGGGGVIFSPLHSKISWKKNFWGKSEVSGAFLEKYGIFSIEKLDLGRIRDLLEEKSIIDLVFTRNLVKLELGEGYLGPEVGRSGAPLQLTLGNCETFWMFCYMMSFSWLILTYYHSIVCHLFVRIAFFQRWMKRAPRPPRPPAFRLWRCLRRYRRYRSCFEWIVRFSTSSGTRRPTRSFSWAVWRTRRWKIEAAFLWNERLEQSVIIISELFLRRQHALSSTNYQRDWVFIPG